MCNTHEPVFRIKSPSVRVCGLAQSDNDELVLLLGALRRPYSRPDVIHRRDNGFISPPQFVTTLWLTATGCHSNYQETGESLLFILGMTNDVESETTRQRTGLRSLCLV